MQAVKRTLLDEKWYNDELADMFKKGAAASLVKDKMVEFNTLLKNKLDPSWSLFRQATSLIEEIKGTCRSQKMSSLLTGYKVSGPNADLGTLGIFSSDKIQSLHKTNEYVALLYCTLVTID